MTSVTVEQILETIKKTKLTQDDRALDATKPLSEQGIDSLDLSGVLFNIEEAFGVEIPDADIDDLQTINDILGYVNNKIK